MARVDVRRAEITLFDTHVSMSGGGLAVGIGHNSVQIFRLATYVQGSSKKTNTHSAFYV